jgi:DNA-binding XRE family transcriptional regulator
MSAAAAVVIERPVIQCRACTLVQYETNSGLCRRCHAPLRDPEPDRLAAIGVAIRLVRTAQDVTLDTLARRSGLSAGTLSRIEAGKQRPSVPSLQRLAQELTVPAHVLVTIAMSMEAVR